MIIAAAAIDAAAATPAERFTACDLNKNRPTPMKRWYASWGLVNGCDHSAMTA
jgi:hypothetical protein